MSDARQIAVVTSTPELIGALRQRADLLGISRDAIDILAELAPGLASKTLSLCPSKGIGLKIVWGLAEAVGLKIALIECPDAMARIAEYVGKRDEKQVRNTNVVSAARIKKKARLERLFSDPRYFNKLGKKGGLARAAILDERQRSLIAIRANRARWKRVRDERRRSRNAQVEAPAIETAALSQSCQPQVPIGNKPHLSYSRKDKHKHDK